MNHTAEPWHVYQGRGANPRLHIGGCDGGNAIFSTPELSRDPRDKEANLARLADCDRAVACVNALAGRVPGELARLEGAADHLLDCAHIPDDVRFLADSDWCIRISVSDYKKLRAALAAFRGEVQQ